MTSPDSHSSGFLQTAPDALRYEYLSLDPDDAGMKLAHLIAPNSRVLDVGCGTGVITDIIRRQKAASIIGIEPDAERVQRAVARGLDVHLGALSPDFIRQHGPFDYIVFADVLEHLPNPAEIVAMARGGLKPGTGLCGLICCAGDLIIKTAESWTRHICDGSRGELSGNFSSGWVFKSLL